MSTTHFIYNIIEEDIKNKKYNRTLCTRFPPEPNGHLHIGHAKSICINFAIREKYKGQCHLRFDDTNPATEDFQYIESIQKDIRWLGFQWDRLCYSSEYFETLYQLALQLIEKGKAYVDSLTEEQVREYRGSHTVPGRNSPYRERSVEENRNLFVRMKEGEFPEGAHVLRAKIDMTSGNMNLRDPLIYRIRYVNHPMTQDRWCIYPLYDFTHGISDAIEKITHSICTLEFEDHRPLYDWFLKELNFKNPPQQIEFSKLLLTHVVLSKRHLKRLVDEGHVRGWDDPRMPTLSGLRRRGYTPESIRHFCNQVGVSRAYSVIDYSLLEECLREDLNSNARRKMAVLRPLKVTLINYDLEQEILKAPHHPQKELGYRELPMCREIWIDQGDFQKEPPKKFFRLKPGGEVRLRNSYIIRCEEVVEDSKGQVVELKCRVDFETLGKNPMNRKVKGTIHWVSAFHAQKIQVHIYDRLFLDPHPGGHKDRDFVDFLNPNSLEIFKDCYAEPSIQDVKSGESVQFERLGYFCLDRSSNLLPVFNQSVGLRETWKKP